MEIELAPEVNDVNRYRFAHNDLWEVSINPAILRRLSE
jgi:hypothetical protein